MFSVVQLRRLVNVVSNECSMCPGCCFGISLSKYVKQSQTVAINMEDIVKARDENRSLIDEILMKVKNYSKPHFIEYIFKHKVAKMVGLILRD